MGNYKKYTYFLDNFSPSAMLTRFVGLNFFAVCYDCHTRWLYLTETFLTQSLILISFHLK